MGFRHGRKRHWTSSNVSSTQQNERNLGGWSVTAIRQAWITFISLYFNLNSLSYSHVMVNNSENFVDPFTGAHSNTIEGVWSQIKRTLKAISGTLKSKLASHLDEYNWQCYPGDSFNNLLADIAEFCPPN